MYNAHDVTGNNRGAFILTSLDVCIGTIIMNEVLNFAFGLQPADVVVRDDCGEGGGHTVLIRRA